MQNEGLALQVNGQYYMKNEGLATGAPTYAILSEVYIQYLEHTSIANILKEHTIIDYFRYVDILIANHQQKTNINNLLDSFNTIHPELKFTMEQQTQQNKLSRSNHYDKSKQTKL
jgi:hypothetical protein